MATIHKLSRVYEGRLDDCLFRPQRFCHRQWEQISGPLGAESSKVKQVACRIGVVIPLILVTLPSYLIASIGLVSRLCSPLDQVDPAREIAEPAQRQANQLPEEQWITPQDQLKRLKDPIIKEITEQTRLIPDLVNMVLNYVDDSVLTNWYTAYTELKPFHVFPEKVPPLPSDIHKTLEGFRKNELSPVLYFIPGGTLRQLLEDMQSYWEEKHPRKTNPLQVTPAGYNEALELYGDLLVEPHWVVMSKEVIPGSRSKGYQEQIALMNALSLPCEVPSLYSTIAMMFLHKIATGESLYPADNNQNGAVCTYTRVLETVERLNPASMEPLQSQHLVVGAFVPSGVAALTSFNANFEYVGMAASRTF